MCEEDECLYVCMYVSRVRVCNCEHAYMHVSANALEPTNHTTFFLFDSVVHVMSAAMTNKKAAMVSTQAASTIESCRVATAVGLADLNA